MSEHPASPAPHRLRQTRTARMARARLARHLQGFGSDRDLWWRVQDLVPEAWATVEEDIDCEEEKVKVTLRLDASVARLSVREQSYQAGINLILSSYAQMRIGEIDRKARSLESILEEYGILQSEEARQAYLSIRDTEGLLEPESRATLDAAFGVRGDRRG